MLKFNPSLRILNKFKSSENGVEAIIKLSLGMKILMDIRMHSICLHGNAANVFCLLDSPELD